MIASKFPISRILSAALVVQCTAALADTTLTFEGGGSEQNPNVYDVDGFPGDVGGGWSGPWEVVVQGQDNLAIEAGVLDENPLGADAGEYLEVKYARLNGDAGSRGGVSRQFSVEPGDGVDPRKPYQVQFQFRLDELSSNFQSPADRFEFAGSVEQVRHGLGVNEQWSVLYRGPDEDGGGEGWQVIIREPDGATRLLSFGLSDLPMMPDTVFTITVSVNPGDKTWDVEIDSDGTRFKASEANQGMPLPLNVTEGSDPPTFLSFRTTRNGTESVTFSIDNIQVSQINE